MMKKGKYAVETFHILRKNFFLHNVGSEAAALAYYLLFAIFPILIFVFNLPGVLKLDVNSISYYLKQFMPADVVMIIQAYLDYITENTNPSLMFFALVFSVWFPMRAVKGLMNSVRRAYGLGKPSNSVRYTAYQLVYTVVFLVVIVLTLLFSTFGEQVLGYVDKFLKEHPFFLTDYVLGLWQYLRFIPVGILMLGATGTLYAFSTDEKQPFKKVIPGLLSALLLWLLSSIGFSFYVENFADYSLIYGALGAVIVLMVWLYLTAFILILGAEINAALSRAKK